ncbi:uncharacterized protein Z518_06493 [Rhinocladiella mackenziei CBS 650.93]|uniref:G-patch domain-containing protein n=1 Tax=Rhinocladiella mackenziei CBS 650.93 TaxID=1442369 RepID=A0A0D2GXP8_9EURO|nr:uncharacterized protein Z518_06493 [Rhinocladiella mackenziei CBS 650.93]KIX02943.1 hypothetical protein Z518_06493 [Rhinocladiella mackenziei CBS 650.93]
MDAHAHLLSLGWAGPGHSLDSRPYKQKGHRGLAYDPSSVGNTGNGLVKPLLISQRQGRLGIGRKAHEPQAGNEWWLKGFETALGNIGKSESERSSGTSTPVRAEHTRGGGKHGGLYSFFIKGQEMEGTIGKPDESEIKRFSKKRKSDVLEDDEEEEQTATSKKQKKATAEFEQIGAYLALRDKDEKRRVRTERPSPVEEFRQVSEYLEAREEKKVKKKKRKSEIPPSENEVDPLIEEQDQGQEKRSARPERKENRRERRRQRREEKKLESKFVEAEDAAAKAARCTGRKRRKAEKGAHPL